MKTRKVFYLALFAFTYLSAFGLQPVKSSKSIVGVQPLQGQQVAKQRLYEGEDSVRDTVVHKCTWVQRKGLGPLEVPGKLTDRPEQLLKRVAYMASYNSDLRIPNWVAWKLTAEHTEGANERKGMRFQEDKEVPKPRAVDADYVRNGYDRGHLCPSADNCWDATAQKQSFLLTNICPQDHKLNVGDWKELESQCRKWAKKYGCIYIVAGPVMMKGEHKTIGKNKITVPEAFFKVVLCMEGQPKAIGFIYRNEGDDRPKSYYVNTIDEVERITGIDFFPTLPNKIEDEVEATSCLDDW